MPEMIDIYDPNMKHIGTKSRDEAHRDGDWHRAFHCWIIARSSEGHRMVVQRRGPDKKLFPSCLDITAAGHYEAGEDISGGLREIREELGIDVQEEDLIPVGVKFDVAQVGDLVNYELDDVFLLEHSSDLQAYSFDPEEVSGLAVFSVEDGLALFSGERSEIPAQARMARKTDGAYEFEDEAISIRTSDFIPRTDPYAYKMLVLAKRCLDGEKHLVV